MTHQDQKKLIANTLRSIAETIGIVTADHLYEMAREVETRDLKERICCPICEEIDCDSDCPLEHIREEIKNPTSYPNKQPLKTNENKQN